MATGRTFAARRRHGTGRYQDMSGLTRAGRAAASCGAGIPALLRDYGVAHVFGMPGVHNLELYRGLEASGLRHIAVRHEQGAGFMADGYARASGRPGVCFVISGPGVTNLATPLGQAYSDSVPVLAVASVVSRADLGMDRGALHEIPDQAAMAAPITGFSAIVHQPEQVPAYLARAFGRFAAGRPRPALISVPLDVLDLPAPDGMEAVTPPGRPEPRGDEILKAAEAIDGCARPILLLGGGAAEAGAEATRLAERIGAGVVTTIAGKGIVPESHPLSLGSTLQRAATRRLVEAADLVIAIGTELAEPDLYVTADAEVGGGDVAPPVLRLSGRLVRIDIDPDTAVRDGPLAAALVADARLAARALVETVAEAPGRAQARQAEFEETRRQVRAGASALEAAHLQVLDALRSVLPPDGLVYADMCQMAYTGCVFFPAERPRCWHFPVGYGTLGYALPAAIGGSIACPGRAVAALVGDGGLLFTVQELATAVEQRLPLPIILWNNEALGEIADFMRARGIGEIGVRPHNPDFAMLARAFGCRSERPASLVELRAAIVQALGADGPTLIEVRQDAALT